MNGAQTLVHTLVASGVDTCFANPGTSEMHFVSALDRIDGMRCVLGLFEGVVTGMADGYFRTTGGPACTLLHLGPGLGNGLANLHNAKKARSGIINIVGEHASYHLQHDAPRRFRKTRSSSTKRCRPVAASAASPRTRSRMTGCA